MLSCKKVTELIEKKQVADLSLLEKFKMKLHTSMCKACKAYQHQSKFIDALLSRLPVKPIDQNEKLSSAAKKKIIEKLKNS